MKITMDNERHDKEFEEIRKLCPWRSRNPSGEVVDWCKATNINCTQKNCTPYYFKKFFEGRK